MSWWKFWGSDKRQRDINFPTLNLKTYRQSEHRSAFENLGTPTRDEAMEYVALFRCITLLINQCADLVVGGLRVVDRDGKIVITERAKHALRVIQETPNEYQSGAEFIREISSDFLLDGNALILIDRTHTYDGSGSRLRSLHRLDNDGSSIVVGDTAMGLTSAVYHARIYGSTVENVFPIRNVAHAKIMPPPSSTTSGGQRQFYSESSLHYLRKAIYIGRQSDAWVGDFFDEGARNNMAIMFPETMSKEMQEKQLKAYEQTLTNKRSPLLLFGGATVTMLNPTPEDADAKALREGSVEEIGRFYGIPAPLINLQVTQWGSGIEQLARLHYRFSARQHLGVILDALSHRILPDGQRFEVDSAQEVRGDTTAMSAFATAMRPTQNGPGIMSRSEVRNSMGLHGDYKDDWGFDPYKEKSNQPLDKEEETV